MNAFRFAMTSFDSKMAARCGKKLCRVARCLSTSSFAGPNACHVASRASANSSCGSFASRNMANWFGPSQSKTQSAVLSRGQEVYELQGLFCSPAYQTGPGPQFLSFMCEFVLLDLLYSKVNVVSAKVLFFLLQFTI